MHVRVCHDWYAKLHTKQLVLIQQVRWSRYEHKPQSCDTRWVAPASYDNIVVLSGQRSKVGTQKWGAWRRLQPPRLRRPYLYNGLVLLMLTDITHQIPAGLSCAYKHSATVALLLPYASTCSDCGTTWSSPTAWMVLITEPAASPSTECWAGRLWCMSCERHSKFKCGQRSLSSILWFACTFPGVPLMALRTLLQFDYEMTGVDTGFSTRCHIESDILHSTNISSIKAYSTEHNGVFNDNTLWSRMNHKLNVCRVIMNNFMFAWFFMSSIACTYNPTRIHIPYYYYDTHAHMNAHMYVHIHPHMMQYTPHTVIQCRPKFVLKLKKLILSSTVFLI